MNVRDALGRAAEQVPEVDAQLLLAHVLGVTRTQLALARERALSPEEATTFERLLARRARREPLAYVLGEWGFRGLVLKTDARALVPRPETEIVVERCLALLAGVDAPAVLDVGVGSGAIALALADEHPGARVTAIDVSPAALALARENADAVGLAVTLEERDLREGLPPGPWDLVVSNPPYVDADELGALEAEVREWEPRTALVDEGQTEAVAEAARHALRAGGWLVLETHADRAGEAEQLLEALDYADVRVTRDLAGRERVVEGRWARSTTR